MNVYGTGYVCHWQFRDEYLATRENKSPNTYRGDKLVLDKFLAFFGDRPVSKITEPELLRFRATLTSNTYVRVFKQGLKAFRVESFCIWNTLETISGTVRYY